MDESVIDILKKQKKNYLKDGFEIIGIFGSYAKQKQTKDSDLDILYDIKPTFLTKYKLSFFLNYMHL